MASIELTTTASVSVGTSLSITVYEDVGNDGAGPSTDPNGKAFDNSATQSIDNGTNTYTLNGFDAGAGNAYWIEVNPNNTDETLTASLNSATLETPTATPTPTATSTPAAPGGQVDNPWYRNYVDPPNLYSDLVRKATVSEPIALLFLGLLAVFGFFSVKLRSVIVGAVWLFMVAAFVLAILVDFSLVYFWVIVIFASVAVVGALVEGGGR